MFSKFIYKYFLACENTPHAWYKNSRFDLENKSSRSLFCRKECSSNYRMSEDKDFCERGPTNVPYYCPQPLLFRYFRDEKIYGSNKIKDFINNDHPLLLLDNSDRQIEYINKYRQDKKEYYETCQNIDSRFFKEYNKIGKNICAYGNANIYSSSDNEQTKNIQNKISGICKQTYCENGEYENFCYKYENIEHSPEDIIRDNNLLTRYLKYFTLLIIVYALVNYFIYAVISTVNNRKFDNPFNFLNNSFNRLANRFGNMGRRFGRRGYMGLGRVGMSARRGFRR